MASTANALDRLIQLLDTARQSDLLRDEYRPVSPSASSLAKEILSSAESKLGRPIAEDLKNDVEMLLTKAGPGKCMMRPLVFSFCLLSADVAARVISKAPFYDPNTLRPLREQVCLMPVKDVSDGTTQASDFPECVVPGQCQCPLFRLTEKCVCFSISQAFLHSFSDGEH